MVMPPNRRIGRSPDECAATNFALESEPKAPADGTELRSFERRSRQATSFGRAIVLPDHVIFFHAFNEAGGSAFANLRSAPNEAGQSLTSMDARHGLLVELVSMRLALD